MTGVAEKPGEAGGAKAGTEVGHAAASPERVKTKKEVGAGDPGPAGAASVPLVGRGTAGKEACERAAAGDSGGWPRGASSGSLVMPVLLCLSELVGRDAAQTQGVERESGHGFDAQLLHEVAAVRYHGRHADAEAFGDLFVRQSAGDVCEHLRFAG